jgi:hypothetical protein
MEPERPIDIDYTRGVITERESLREHEDIDTIIAAGVHLAERRAEAFGREPTQADLEYGLSILCVWPIKTRPPDQVIDLLVALRQQAFSGVAAGDFTALDSLVPEPTLTSSKEELADLQQQTPSAFLNVRRGEPA